MPGNSRSPRRTPLPTQDDLDKIADAARRYSSLRERYWWCYFSALPMGSLIVLLSEYRPQIHRIVYGILIPPLALGFLACIICGMAAAFSIRSFRCPRCGKGFAISWDRKKTCRFCLLSLREG